MPPGPGPTDSPASATRRVALMLAWVVIMALWPATAWPWLGISAGLLLGLSLAWRLPVPSLLRRLLVVWTLTALCGVGLIGQPHGGLRVGNLFLKSTLSLWALSLLVHRTGLPGIVGGLRRLGLPVLLTETVAFWGRYFGVLRDEWQRLQLARRARTYRASRRLRFQVLANGLGLLFVRAYERAEKVHRAMLARGYRA